MVEIIEEMGGIKVCGLETNINLPLLLWNITEVGSWLRFKRVNDITN
jgi:hypothetical protein